MVWFLYQGSKLDNIYLYMFSIHVYFSPLTACFHKVKSKVQQTGCKYYKVFPFWLVAVQTIFSSVSSRNYSDYGFMVGSTAWKWLQPLSWDNRRVHLIYFPPLRFHSPMFPAVHCVKIVVIYILFDFLVVYYRREILVAVKPSWEEVQVNNFILHSFSKSDKEYLQGQLKCYCSHVKHTQTKTTILIF